MLATGILNAEKPNIVLILSDDIGLGDIGMQHRERTGKEPLAPTPTLDRLAADGLWCTDAHSPNALCSPTRYAVLSGNYTYRSHSPWGVWGSFRQSQFKDGQATLGTVLQGAGYTTGFVGKWHLGGDFYTKGSKQLYRGDDRGDTPLEVDATRWIGKGPRNLGFDYDFTLPTGVQGPFYVAYENAEWYPLAKDSKLIHFDKDTAADPAFVSDKGPGTGDSRWDTRKIPEVIAHKAADFIRDNAGSTPFFLYYCTPTVHLPHLPAKTLDGKPIAGTTPTAHTDLCRVLDWEVEQIVKALKETGEYEDTLFLFTSDNGGLSDGKAGKAGHFSNGGYRGTKNLAYEGGHRVPLIAVWPGVIKPGSRSDAMINGTDMMATFAELTGVRLKQADGLDSYSFLPLLKGDRSFKGRETLLLQSGTPNQLIYREGNWKLMIQTDHKFTKWDIMALFNLEDNAVEDEARNLWNDPEYRDRAEAMYERYRAIRDSKKRSVPLKR